MDLNGYGEKLARSPETWPITRLNLSKGRSRAQGRLIAAGEAPHQGNK